MLKVEHVWHEPCDRWIYIEYYDDATIGLNYCQGGDYVYFKQHYCKVDEGLTEFYEVMCRDYNIEKMSNTKIQFMSKVMWTYHTATSLMDDYMGNELFWKVEWSIIVGAVGNDHWKTISALPCTNKMV